MQFCESLTRINLNELYVKICQLSESIFYVLLFECRGSACGYFKCSIGGIYQVLYASLYALGVPQRVSHVLNTGIVLTLIFSGSIKPYFAYLCLHRFTWMCDRLSAFPSLLSGGSYVYV